MLCVFFSESRKPVSFPGVIFYLTLWYPSRLRAPEPPGFVAAIAVSGVIGNPISGWIMDTVFRREGADGMAVVIPVGRHSLGHRRHLGDYFILNSSIEEAKWLTAEEKALLAKNLLAEEKHKAEHKLSDAFKSGKVWVLCVIYFTLMIGLYGIAFWLPTIVKAFGIKGYLGVGLITAIPYGVCCDWNDPFEPSFR